MLILLALLYAQIYLHLREHVNSYTDSVYFFPMKGGFPLSPDLSEKASIATNAIGKTYIACALTHRACLDGFTSRYTDCHVYGRN